MDMTVMVMLTLSRMKRTKLNFSNVCKCEDVQYMPTAVLVEGAHWGRYRQRLHIDVVASNGLRTLEILQEWGASPSGYSPKVLRPEDEIQHMSIAYTLLYHPDPKLRQAVISFTMLN